jgi:hypothetical protein
VDDDMRLNIVTPNVLKAIGYKIETRGETKTRYISTYKALPQEYIKTVPGEPLFLKFYLNTSPQAIITFMNCRDDGDGAR